MLGIDARAARAAWTVLLVCACVFVIYQIRRTLLLFTVALLLAYLLAPLVDLPDRIAPKRFPRLLRLAVVYVLLLGLLVTAGGLVGTRVVLEATDLAKQVPQWLGQPDLLARVPVPAWMEPWREEAIATLRQQLEANVKEVVPLLREIGERIVGVATNIGFVVLVPVLSFFFLKDAPEIRQSILERFLEGPHRRFVEDVLSDVHVLLGQFMRALVILAALTFVFYGLFFGIIGVPYAVLLAGIAALLEFIPMIGPLSAAIGILLVAALGNGWALALWVLIFLLAYRMFQDYVLQPFLMSAGTALHPAWVIFGVMAGEQLAGVVGMFLSIPTLATLRVIVIRIEKARAHDASPTQAGV